MNTVRPVIDNSTHSYSDEYIDMYDENTNFNTNTHTNNTPIWTSN